MAENTIKAGLDVSEIESGAKKAGVALRSIGKAAEEAGKQSAAGAAATAAGYDKAAKEAERLANKQERATQSIINAVQREIAVREAGGRGTSAYYELLARQRGADVARISEVTQALKRQESQLKLNNISVGQYNNAMRMVPAQFTDIFTQLAGGQNPFLIALQQGGQLRDSFGGFGNMFKGLAASINPATVAVAALAGGVAALGKAYYDGAEESQRFSAAVIFAGGSAGASADKLLSIADSVGRTTGGWSEARSAILAFVESGSVASENYGRFAESVVLQSKATGKSVEDLARVYEEIADDPLKAVVKFSRVYQTLNADVYEQARALIEHGRQQEAVALVQSKFSDESQKMSERVLENLGAIERGWKAIKEAASEAWEGMKEIGRDATLERRLFVEQEGLERAKAFAKNNPDGQRMVEQQQRVVDSLKEQIKRRDEAAKQLEATRKEQADSASAAANFERLRDQTQSKAERFAREIRFWQGELNKLRKHGSKQQIADAEKYLAQLRQQRKEELAADAARAAKRSQQAAKQNKEKYTVNRTVLEQAEKYDYAGLEKRYGLPKNLLAALSMQESRGNVNAISPDGARGTMQFMPGTAKQYGVDVRSIASSADGAARYLRDLLKRYDNNIVKALTAYHSGEGNVNKGRIGPVGRRYAPEVLARQNWLNGGRGEIVDDPRREFYRPSASKSKPELTDYEKWQQDFSKRQLAVNAELSLSAANVNKIYAEQLRLLSDPTFEKWSASERQAAMDSAVKADNQAQLTKEAKKYADALQELDAAGQRDFDDQLFELSLLGKSREEVERLTAARKYDKLIAEAIASGASADVIKRLQTAKLDNDGRLQERLRLEKETKDAFDNNWLAGISDGMRNYANSFQSMRESMSDAVSGSLGKMSDSLADFVVTGKADFRGLAASILQDLSRMLIKMALFNAMKAAMGAWGGGGFRDGGMVQQFSNGGAVWGAGTSTSDSIPALLSNGEFVVNAAATRRHRALLEAVNQNRYASGGAVGKLPVMPAVPAFGASAGSMTVNITINKDGTASADTSADTSEARRLAEAIPAMVERWYADNVYRVGGRYYAR
ncbi:phage tail length tape measure family protein [Neisseria cinerea]|uniref:phage tail length tape measure family protein n=1 Tax=Neisseria cinerea TaxID=483 RepID=UPI002B1D0847|nr:phage tail length tape measure family protein [Neisseria cinerea]